MPARAVLLLLGALLVACRPAATADAPSSPSAATAPAAPPTAPPPSATPPAAPPTAAAPAGTGNADVLFVAVRETAPGRWTFAVTVAHPDTGWEDYANGWDVVAPDGAVLKPDPAAPFTRLLLHPHESEQPFTRSQSGIVVPPEVTHVTVRAHDLVDGFGGRVVVVDLTRPAGPDFTVTPLATDG